jgi:hypothetical protein
MNKHEEYTEKQDSSRKLSADEHNSSNQIVLVYFLVCLIVVNIFDIV